MKKLKKNGNIHAIPSFRLNFIVIGSLILIFLLVYKNELEYDILYI